MLEDNGRQPVARCATVHLSIYPTSWDGAVVLDFFEEDAKGVCEDGGEVLKGPCLRLGRHGCVVELVLMRDGTMVWFQRLKFLIVYFDSTIRSTTPRPFDYAPMIPCPSVPSRLCHLAMSCHYPNLPCFIPSSRSLPHDISKHNSFVYTTNSF
jgi:hypothetical protein